MEDIKSTFPKLYDGNTPNRKPIAQGYRNFASLWGLQKTIFEASHESLVEYQKIQEMYATTFLNYLCYLKDKAIAEEAQDQLDEQIRKSKRH